MISVVLTWIGTRVSSNEGLSFGELNISGKALKSVQICESGTEAEKKPARPTEGSLQECIQYT